MDKYCYHGLLWLAQGEDVNIYDAESGDLLVGDFTLSDRKDTIFIGEDMKETILWTNSGSTNPSTITLDDDYTKYKYIVVIASKSDNNKNYLRGNIYTTSIIKNITNANIGFYSDANTHVWYQITSNTSLSKSSEGSGSVIMAIIGYC